MSEWFKRSDRLPTPDGVTVLGFWQPAPGGEIGGMSYATVTYWEGRWHNPEDDDDDYAEPSHWMFILPPPTEKNAEGKAE